MTALAALRDDYIAERDRARNGEPWRNMHAVTAWERYAEEVARQGRPLDALVQRIEDEAERFFSRVISGVDGHAYWPLADMRFVKNDGSERSARLWWWEHIHGSLAHRGDSVKPTCGELNCIAPPHQERVDWAARRRQYTDAQCVGGLQAAAMKLGYTPTRAEYKDRRFKPHHQIVATRFGSWENAVAVACLDAPRPRETEPRTKRWSDDDLLAALRSKSVELGRVPSGKLWMREHWSPSRKTIERRFGGWPAALRAAGLA